MTVVGFPRPLTATEYRHNERVETPGCRHQAIVGTRHDARPAQPRGGQTLRILATVLVTVLVMLAGAVAAIHFGLLDIGVQTAAVAQQATAQTAAPQGTAPQNAAPAAPTAAPAQAPTPAQPEMARRQDYGDWVYGCFPGPNDGDMRCSINQSLLDANSRALIFFWRIIEDGQGGLVSIVRTPDTVLLQPGIKLDAGAPEPLVIPYVACNRGLCQAVAKLTADFTNRLATTEKVTATVVGQNGRTVAVPISVNGLAQALGALRQAAPSAAPAPAQ